MQYNEKQKAELEFLENRIQVLNQLQLEAIAAKEDWENRIENNVYSSIEEATELEETLSAYAHAACEGSHRFGNSSYSREFMVGEDRYVAKLENIQYNRHYKTYYYIDDYDFNIYPVNN